MYLKTMFLITSLSETSRNKPVFGKLSSHPYFQKLILSHLAFPKKNDIQCENLGFGIPLKSRSPVCRRSPMLKRIAYTINWSTHTPAIVSAAAHPSTHQFNSSIDPHPHPDHRPTGEKNCALYFCVGWGK